MRRLLWALVPLWLMILLLWWSPGWTTGLHTGRGGLGTGTGTGTGAGGERVSKHPAGDRIMLETGDFLLQENNSYLFKE